MHPPPVCSDFGIDALYFEPPDDGELHVTLIQGKYKVNLRSVSAFPENGVAGMIVAIRALFDASLPVQLNRRLNERTEDVRSFVRDGAIPTVTAVVANNGCRWTEPGQQRIDNAARDFGRQVEWRHIGSEELLALLQARKPIDADLQLVGAATVETFDFRRALTGRMSVAELARLTITCSQFRHNALQRANWSVQVSDLQIVNGGQTARTVQHAAEEIGPEIGAAEVLIRIHELEKDDAELVEAITFATNSQNPVDLRDLKANDPRQKALGQSISELGYRYRAKT